MNESPEVHDFDGSPGPTVRPSFQEQHPGDDWIHGPGSQRSLILYKPLPFYAGTNMKTERHFTLEFSMTPVGALAALRHLSFDSVSDHDPLPQPQPPLLERKQSMELDRQMLKSDDYESPFSGLLHMPSFSYSRPGGFKNTATTQYIYHTHFEVGEVTYFFGGLHVNPLLALKQMGIPRSTNLDDISVQLPCDLPPFVKRDVLMSPVFARNQEFLIFNPIRSTVHEFQNSCDVEPSQLLELKGSQISDFQIFFCGGFKVNVDDVTFDRAANRWIVKKSIALNKDGFILDVRTLKFTKILILLKLEFLYDGRVGSGVCSNFYDMQSDSKSAPNDQALKTASTEYSEDSSKESQHTSQSLDIASPTPLKSHPKLQINTDVNHPAHRRLSASLPKSLSARSHENADLQSSSTSLSSKSSGKTSERTTEVELSTPLLEKREKKLEKSLRKSEDNQFKVDELHKHEGKGSTGMSHKMPAMLAKSSRFFHRNLLKHYSANTPPTSVHSSYSDQVKHHRSKSHSSTAGDGKHSQVSALKSPASFINHEAVPSPSELTYSVPTSISNLQVESSSVTEEKKIDLTGYSDQAARKSQESIVISDAPEENTAASHESNELGFAGDNSLKTGLLSVCVYMFGGFSLHKDESGRQYFRATNDLIKLELLFCDFSNFSFHPEALALKVTEKSALKPSPRGYFAHVLTPAEQSHEACAMFNTKFFMGLYTESKFGSPDKYRDVTLNGDAYFESRILIVHGGVNDKQDVFGDCFYFHFGRLEWIPIQTFAFDYYEKPKQPYEDEDSTKLRLEDQVENAQLVDAEFRCCHHKAILYWEGNKEFLAFLGGFNNDYLRHYDKVPYESTKFDVSRLSKLLISSTNSNLLRIPVLNLRSQVWKFKRYFFDLTELAEPTFVDAIRQPYMRNCRLALSAGGILIVGKQLTFCHGLAEFVPEKKEDYELYKQKYHNDTLLLGGHFHLTFPGM